MTIDNNVPMQASCVARHIGLWMVETTWFAGAVAAAKAGAFQVQRVEPNQEALYTSDQGGIASIAMIGPMMKGPSKFGGTDTVRTRGAVRAPASDPSVKAVMLHIDSPGGTVAGTAELAGDVRAANKFKPVFAHIEDLGASAAFYVASQARRITATATSHVGSIGTMATVVDSSEAASMEGIKVHVISTGSHKGDLADGTPVTDEQLAEVQRLANETNQHFLAAVKAGRGLSAAQLREASDGRVFLAAQAQDMGLIDAVATVDQAFKFVRDDIRETERRGRAMARARAGADG